jgi:transketolase
MMHQPVIFVYTHDSIFVGEDGPTHQPIEQLMAMRAIPNLWVIRPADAQETVQAWQMALRRRNGPVALCLTRQKLPVLDRMEEVGVENTAKGAYVLSDRPTPRLVLLATGSEVQLAVQARAQLDKEGIASRVVSMPCWEAFAEQPKSYQQEVLPVGINCLSIEAGLTFGWERFVAPNGASIGIDRYGVSAPGAVAAQALGLTVDAVLAKARELCQ